MSAASRPYGNEPVNALIALATFAALVGAVALGSRYGPLSRRLRRRRDAGDASAFDRYLLALVERTLAPLAYVAAAFVAISTLHLDAQARHALRAAGTIVGAWALVRVATGLLRFAVDGYVARNAERGLSGANLRSFVPFVEVLAWGFATVFVLDDLGFHVSAIVAGLGIGGAAVALAAQAILRDWFGYVAIVSDRPFEIGHLVGIGPEYVGTIDAIGVRSVRMRSLSGEEVTLPNNDVASSRLRNFSRMQERRIVFTFVVAHATPTARLREIPELVRAAIEARGLTRFDRSHWLAFADAGFVFENVYFVLSPEYDLYMDCQHEINLAIVDALRARGIDLAGPPSAVEAANAGKESV